MSRKHVSATQESDQEAALTLAIEGTEQGMAANNPQARRIRVSHVLLLGGLGALGPLANDMYVLALPALSRDLNASASQAQLTLSAFILGLALGQVIVGPISDACGRRWPLLIGVAVYALASVLRRHSSAESPRLVRPWQSPRRDSWSENPVAHKRPELAPYPGRQTEEQLSRGRTTTRSRWIIRIVGVLVVAVDNRGEPVSK
jgi:hypothetical protein